MSGYTDFIKRFSAANVGPAPTVPNNPDTFYKVAAARQNGTGQGNPDPVEQDLINLSTSEILQKYGPAGVQMVQQRALGDARFTRDRYDPTGNTPFDVVSGVTKGFLMGVGGIGALGAGLVNDDLGAWSSEKLTEFDSWVRDNQSSGLNARRRANQASNAVEFQDNQTTFERERKESGDFVAGLRKIGRDAMSAVGNAVDDPTILADGIADAAGSLVGGGIVSKGAKILGSKALQGLLSRGVLSEGAALKASEFGSKISMPTTIGSMEAGGAYQQTVQSVMQMSHDDLVLGSPEYSKLISEGWTPEDAKTELATSAGLTAAALQFPVAAAAGTLVSKFEANPFRGAASGLGVVKNGATEAIEEAVQSGFGQFAGNVGTQAFANQNQDLTEGVGEQAGLGALYGVGSAVGVQVPGSAVNATVTGVKAAASGAAKIGSQVVNAVDSRVSAIKDSIASASPVSADNINTAVETKLAEAPAIVEQIRADVAEEKLAPDQGKIIEDRLNQLTNTITFDRAELDQTDLSPEIKDVIGAATNKFDALRRASILAGSTQVPPQARIEAAIYINDTLNTIGGQMVNNLNQAVEPLPDDHSSLPKLREFEDVLINLQNNPEIQNARKAAISHVEKLKADSLSEAAVATPKGEQAVRAVASVAESNPEAISEDMANLVLEHARLGRVKLTPRQLRAVQSSATLSRVANTYKIESKKAGITERDIVNKQILTDEVQGSDLPSMAGHVKGVNEAYSAGNLPLAAERLQRFAAFAQHFQNKLAAINEAYATGADSDKRAVKYQALMPSGKWDRSIKGVYVKPTTEGSLKTAQSINLEARALADVANEMALRMPEMGVNPVEVGELNPDLVGNVKQLVQKFRNPAPKAPTKFIELIEEPAKVEPAQAQPSTVQTESKAPVADAVVEAPTETPTVEGREIRSTIESTKPETVEPEQPKETAQLVEGPEQADAAQPQQDAIQPETVDAVEGVEVQTVAELYPDLYENGKVQNWLKQAFKLPKTDRTRTIGTGNPAAVVSEAFVSQQAYEKLLGKKAKKTLSSDLSKDYQTFLGFGQKISQTMAKNLLDFLEVKTSKNGPTFREALMNGLDSETQVNEFIRGKVLAIVQQVGENDFGYNSELAETAVLAGLQYVLVAGAKTSNFDAESLADMLKITEVEAAPHVAWFNQGVWTKSAKRELADMITKYWGLTPDSSMPEGIVRGIPESVASEVIRGLLDAKLLILNKTEINGKPYEQYVLNPENEALITSLKRFPTAIEEAVLVEPENINHIGTPPSSAAKSQLHGSPVKLKAKQVEFIETAQKVAHRVNTQMLDFTRMLGAAGIEGLFGRGKRTLEKTNVNTVKSIEGYNRTVMSAYSALTDLVSEMENYAKTNDMALEDVDVFYEYGISSVGRAQMQGRANPQSSKIVREVMLPTWSTLDLSDKKSDHYQAFMLAVGQHIGVKVHKLKAEAAIEETETKLGEPGFAGLINDIESWMDQWDGNDPLPLKADDFAPFKKVLGDKTAPGAVHALMEYSRYLNASVEERSNFKTALYLEADGVTDGPINALVNLVGGIFKPEWVNLVNRGGLFLGSNEMSLADYIGQEAVPYGNGKMETKNDLYQIGTNFLVDAVKRMTDKVKDKKATKDINDALTRVMVDLLPEMEFKLVDDKPALSFDRGITKNPLTVTVYGSGVRGIGSKITAAILEKLYETYPTYNDLPSKMRDDIRYLSTFSAFNKFGEIKLKKREDVDLRISPDENFTLTSSMVKNITDNVTTLFAQPLTEAIGEIMGDAMSSATVMRRATQAQSIFFKYAYRQGIADALALKGTKAGQFLSRNELDGIFSKLLKRFPLIETDAQMIWVGGSAQSDIETSEFGKALDESQRSPGYVYGPENAGVSGIPFIVIATGDGEMILNALTGEDAPQNTLPVFDGINLKLDTIKEDSRKINKAVYDGWLRNPLRAVERSFTKFLEDGGINDARGEVSDEMFLELEKTFKDGPDFTFISPEFHLKDIHVQLQDLADELDARKAVLAKVNMSVDHMASAAAPYVKTDGVELPADPVAASQILNTMLADEMKKLPKRKPLKIYEAPSEDVSKFIELVSDGHVTGARILDLQAMRLGIDELNIPLDQKGLVRASINSLATEGWSIVHGNVDQLATHASYYDITLPNNWSEQYGLALPDSKTIFLMSSSSETLTHELIHAATVQQVFAYYAGSKVQKDVPATIQRIEALMSDFLKIDPKSIKNDEALKDFLHVRDMLIKMSERTDGSRAINKTQALNEFMAWTLANQGLSDIARKNEAGPLGRMVQAVMDALRKLFWRAGLAPSAGADIYSNLRFNTLLLMQPKAYNVIAPQKLVGMAQFQSSRYGSSDRLSVLEVTFARKMLDALPADTMQNFRMSEKYKAMNRMAAQVRKTFQTAKFDMSPKEASFFETLVMALAVDKSLNSNAQSRLEEVFRHVLDNIKVEDFMEDPDRDDPNDRRDAQQKYNTLVGRNFVGKDLNSRSMMMPAFLALALVNEGFRNVLAKMPMPQSEKRSEGTLDSVLSTYGVEFMDRLSRSLSGEGKPTDVLEAIEALTAKMAEVQSDREVMIEAGIDTVGNGIDTAQDWVVGQMNRLTQKGADKLSEINENTDNKYVKLAARAGEAMLGIFNEDISSGLVEGYTSQLNKAEVWKPVRELFAEVVGRTEANAPIYDMIKAVRSYIQQLRQIYREKLPAVIAEKFSRKLTKDEWSSLYHTLAKTDLAALRPLGSTRVLDMLRDAGKLKTETARLEATVRKLDGTNGTKLLQKSQELAEYMTSGKVSGNLLRNADAIANLFDEIPARVRIARGKPPKNLVSAIDQLTSLYALAMTSTKDRTLAAELAANEGAGVDFAFNYLVGQKQNENEKLATDRGRINRFKGYTPTESRSGSSLVVADDRNYADLIIRGYTRLGDYKGSLSERGLASQGYYFAPLSGKSAFNQGIAQNVRDTFHGVDPVSGFSIDSYGAGRITDQVEVRRAYARRGQNSGQKEALMPIFDSDGDVVAYERSLDPDQLAKVEKEEDLSKVLGIWRGRQVEEKSADQFNRLLVDRVQKIWEDRSVGREDEFINLMDEKSHKDPVVTDAVKLLTPSMRRHIEDAFGDGSFMVRKDMINDIIGYRSASIGDLWTGNTRLPPETAKVASNILTAMMGKDAYKYLVTGEKLWQNFVSDARTTIVVRSIVVPASNLLSNVYQLASRGVPLKDIARGMPKKLAEIHSYHENHQKEIKLEAELLAVKNNPAKANAIRAQIKSLQDGHRRLSIWPLIAAGEFSSVSEATVIREESTLFEGKVTQYMEALVDKLPDSVRTAGRYAIISRDTALFQGLQRAVEYGDFLAKAVLYDELTKRKGMEQKEALARVGEEFVNYDRLPGRFRGSMESMGLLWFWHFKLRAIKIAMSTVRNNPLHMIMAGAVPAPDFFGSVGLPVTDNAVAIAAEGKLNYSVGPLQGFHAHALNPWVNLFG